MASSRTEPCFRRSEGISRTRGPAREPNSFQPAAFSDDQTQRTIAAEGDHLTFSSPKSKKIAVPSSTADFLLFDPDDLSEYSRLHFEEDVHKKMTITVSDESGAPVATMIKVP